MAEAVYRRIAVQTSREQAAGVQAKGINRNLAFVALAALVLIACSLFYVWTQHQILTLGYEISQTAREEQELLHRNQKLRLELAALKSPARIESMALNELGFVNPKKEQLIIVR